MLEVTEQRPMNNEYANSWISKLSPVTLRISIIITIYWLFVQFSLLQNLINVFHFQEKQSANKETR